MSGGIVFGGTGEAQTLHTSGSFCVKIEEVRCVKKGEKEEGGLLWTMITAPAVNYKVRSIPFERLIGSAHHLVFWEEKDRRTCPVGVRFRGTTEYRHAIGTLYFW
jgi:hypothetical protein